MAKRFFDSRKYQDPWFRRLSPNHKTFWDYLLSTCNHAGFWKVDFEMAEYLVGCKLDPENILNIFNCGKERIKVVREDLWFLSGYIIFQYGNPNKSAAFKSAAKMIYDMDLVGVLPLKYRTLIEQLAKGWVRATTTTTSKTTTTTRKPRGGTYSSVEDVIGDYQDTIKDFKERGKYAS